MITTTACPVRSLTPDVREVLTWFQRTHRVEMVGQTPVWRQTVQPHDGGLAHQDAWLTAALDVARETANALLRRRAATDRDLAEIHESIRRKTVH